MQYVISLIDMARANKGDIMYGNEIIEFEDNSFNHFIHHFDECDEEHPHFNDQYGCIEIAAELMEEIIWN
ncbi:MAG: hypothetical protein WC667_12715 [Sulfurimonas sp.]|jgi:hypothetical protein